jgi:CelD/BcsL family acetyltransferase involved in cellulose biosynthesis
VSAVAEFVSLEALRQAAPEWADLCARACEPNPFADPAFLLPLIAYEKPRVRFVLVREAGRLIGFSALRTPLLGLASVWMSGYAALPACAFDAERADVAVAALRTLLVERTRLSGVVFGFVEREGALAGALRAAGPVVVAGGTQRAALKLAGVAAFEASLNPKRAAKWKRQLRKLSSQGKFEATSGPEQIEAFFEVEPRGWKGARGTALADDPARLAFARAALGAFAEAGRLDAMALRLDGKPLAAGLVLKAGARAFYWKTAYDEAFAEASPGVQLTLLHSRRLAQTPGLAWVDSCAREDHPMIGRVWGDALTFEDLALALRSKRALGIWLGLGRLKARGREAVKGAVNRRMGRKSV